MVDGIHAMAFEGMCISNIDHATTVMLRIYRKDNKTGDLFARARAPGVTYCGDGSLAFPLNGDFAANSSYFSEAPTIAEDDAKLRQKMVHSEILTVDPFTEPIHDRVDIDERITNVVAVLCRSLGVDSFDLRVFPRYRHYSGNRGIIYPIVGAVHTVSEPMMVWWSYYDCEESQPSIETRERLADEGHPSDVVLLKNLNSHGITFSVERGRVKRRGR